MASKLKKAEYKAKRLLKHKRSMSFKIEDAKSLKDFLVEWGMSEGDAKKTALRIVFDIDDFSEFNAKTSTADMRPLTKLMDAMQGAIRPNY